MAASWVDTCFGTLRWSWGETVHFNQVEPHTYHPSGAVRAVANRHLVGSQVFCVWTKAMLCGMMKKHTAGCSVKVFLWMIPCFASLV